MMKLVNIFFTILFLLFAMLQYNDPDPYIWMPIYLYGALLCYWAIKKKYISLMYIIGIVLYSGYALYLLLDKTGVLNWINQHESENIVQTMKADKPWIEETREFFGLIILITVLVINMIWLSKHQSMQVAGGKGKIIKDDKNENNQ